MGLSTNANQIVRSSRETKTSRWDVATIEICFKAGFWFGAGESFHIVDLEWDFRALHQAFKSEVNFLLFGGLGCFFYSTKPFGTHLSVQYSPVSICYHIVSSLASTHILTPLLLKTFSPACAVNPTHCPTLLIASPTTCTSLNLLSRNSLVSTYSGDLSVVMKSSVAA